MPSPQPSTRRLMIAVFAVTVLFTLYHQTRLLQEYYLSVASTMIAQEEGAAHRYYFPHDSSLLSPSSSSSSITENSLSTITPLDSQQPQPQPHPLPPPETVNARRHDSEDREDHTSTQGTGVNAAATTATTSVLLREPVPRRKWAYAFLVGGCADNRPEYRGFLYNVIASAQRLQQLGSQADVVVMVQMSGASKATALPEKEQAVLEAMGIRVHYIPKMAAPVHEVFYALVMEKFRILELTDYSRVLFLDGDIMPLCNLDYIFELSEPEEQEGGGGGGNEPFLKENVVLSWGKEAATAGFFMLKPDKEDFRRINEIIQAKEEKALPLPFPHWNEMEGWGHVIEAPDFWRSPVGLTGTNWTWHASFADQGLLYHWTKYVKQSVSLIIHGDVENWGSSRNGTAHLERLVQGGALSSHSCPQAISRKRRPSPYQDFVHFTGRSKPWGGNKTRLYREEMIRNSTQDAAALLRERPKDTTLMWYLALEAAENATNFDFDFSFAKGTSQGAPPVGRFSSYGQMIEHIRARAKRNWTHYQ